MDVKDLSFHYLRESNIYNSLILTIFISKIQILLRLFRTCDLTLNIKSKLMK